MVIRVLPFNGDCYLLDPGENFGNDADTLLFQSGIGSAASYGFHTGSNGDLIDLTDANSGNVHSIYAGSGNDTVIGSGCISEFYFDQSGNDFVDMAGAIDNIILGLGNDTIYGGSGIDTIYLGYIFDNSDNSLLVTAGIKIDLSIKQSQDLGVFGKDLLSGFENVEGSELSDTISGDALANKITGGDGNDILTGKGGNDTVYGNDGRDTLINGTGIDEFNLYESTDARDIVRFTSFKDSGIGASSQNIDMIVWFDVRGNTTSDLIDLRSLDARVSTAKNDAFVFRGTGAFTQAGGEVRVRWLEGNRYLVEIDNDADAATEMSFLVQASSSYHILDAPDFLL